MSKGKIPPSRKAGVWPTKVEVQCRNETPFKAIIKFYPNPKLGLRPHIDCPHCGRFYHLMADGEWVSDRPLTILS